MRTGFDTLVTTPLDMSLNTTPCVSCGRCAETCPTGALMPKPRVLEKYEVDESRCILCGICVDACPYDALRCGPDFELATTAAQEPIIDLMAISSLDRDTEVSYVRRERDWLQRGRGAGSNHRRWPAAADAASGRRRGDRQRPWHGQRARPRRRPRPRRRRQLMGGALVLADLALPPTIPFLEWRWDDLLFLILAGILLAAALLVVLGRDIIRSGLSMILAFGALAGIYVLLGATLVAAAQVLVYIGAISVLILFAIMLTQTKGGPLPLVFHRQAWAGALAAIGVVALLLISIINTDWPGKLADRLWTATDR